MRTDWEPSRISGRSFGSMAPVGRGRDWLTGKEEIEVARYERASFRCWSDLDDVARER